jgi:hypothetical protein
MLAGCLQSVFTRISRSGMSVGFDRTRYYRKQTPQGRR